MAYIPKTKRKKYNPAPPKTFGQDDFYNRGTWRKISKDLRDCFIICPVCEVKPSEMTDHVIPRSFGGADYDYRNLLPMCHSCHNRKRALERSGPLLEYKESDKQKGFIPKSNKLNIIPRLKK